jgi:signal transduction histidine kinase
MLAVPLRASEEMVGTLLVSSDGDDGLEPRRERVVAQLLPTVVLVVRAVGLALVAQDSRNDLARQRERERARILQDLHDDLGPALAGMSMRVRAAQTDAPSDLLVMLATDLATCRADLRRIVQGLAPHALAEGDVAGALHDLVGSFRTPAGPVVALDGAVPDDILPEYAVVLYRFVAEGMSNALRHARPTHVRASLTRVAGALTAVVEDDGRAPGPVVPGVGLSSLGARARELGGSLVLEPVEPFGTRLRITLQEPPG